MSRKAVNSVNRCPICGGRMKLVNVTRVNTFRTPEASQYDLSVSNRKEMFGNGTMSSSQEMMCSNCGLHSPVENGKRKRAKGEKKNRAGKIVGWIIFIIVLAVAAYFVCKYRDNFGMAAQRLGDLWNKAVGFFTGLFKK